MSEQKGIEHLKAAVKFLLKLGNAAGASLEDGKITFSDVAHLIGVVPTILPAVSSLSSIKGEVLDLSDAEKADLKVFIQSEFDLPQDNIEAIVEKLLFVLVDLSKLLDLVAKKS
jgi:hypothetical protein